MQVMQHSRSTTCKQHHGKDRLCRALKSKSRHVTSMSKETAAWAGGYIPADLSCAVLSMEQVLRLRWTKGGLEKDCIGVWIHQLSSCLHCVMQEGLSAATKDLQHLMQEGLLAQPQILNPALVAAGRAAGV